MWLSCRCVSSNVSVCGSLHNAALEKRIIAMSLQTSASICADSISTHTITAPALPEPENSTVTMRTCQKSCLHMVVITRRLCFCLSASISLLQSCSNSTSLPFPIPLWIKRVWDDGYLQWDLMAVFGEGGGLVRSPFHLCSSRTRLTQRLAFCFWGNKSPC